MNRYQRMMEQVPIPAGQAERLKAAVLAAEPERKRRVYRPRSVGKKVLLAALVTVALTATVGAAVAGVDWSWIFTEQFGEDAAATDMAAELFQEVGVTSVCDDVTLTVRETVGDDHMIYMILDYQFPDTVDRAELAERWREVEMAGLWAVVFVQTDAVAWEDIRGQDFDEAWKNVARSVPVDDNRQGRWFVGGSVGRRGYDPETNTMTWLLSAKPDLSTNLTEWPLTVVMDALVLGDEPLTDHPAIVTFQPVNNVRTVSGACEDGETGISFQAALSPLALKIKAKKEVYEPFEGSYQEFSEEERNYYVVTSLVFQDGTAVPAVELAEGVNISGGGGTPPVVDMFLSFEELLDITDVCAIRIGNLEIPVS